MKAIPVVIQLVLLAIWLPVENDAQIITKKSSYSWLEIDDWSPCSTTCGLGTQQKTSVCLKRQMYSETIEPDKFCNSIQKPNATIRDCNFGNCSKVYSWRPSPWGACSQTCGNAGRRTREIDCLYNEGEHVMELSNDEYCESTLRPPGSSSCNLLDCPPVFVTGNWERCIAPRRCMVGKQKRSLDCVMLLKTGKPKKIPKNLCYSKFFPPQSWKKCFEHLNTNDCLKSNKQTPEIETKNNTFIQMRRSKNLKLQIGQTAYVLLSTKIVLRCPVNYFVTKDLIWKHKSTIYRFLKTKRSRIRVDDKGRLRISKFAYDDQGQWTCVAGPINASSIIKFRNPSIGYHDWVLRSTLWNKEMLNEAPQSKVARKEVIQWIIGSWSACSVTCGGEGIQSRDVHCEEIDTRHYSVLDDGVCLHLGQKKPEARRSCVRPSQCPKWILNDNDRLKCTEDCLRIGVAKIKSKLICSYQEKEVDTGMCMEETMPEIGCWNENCQVKWRTSPWSKCSLSCGGLGVMGRYVVCVWRNNGKPAGSLCYQQLLMIPTVIKACVAPICNLKCVDLYSNCKGQERFCKLSIYTYMCCSTCKKVYLLFRSQSIKEKFVYKKSESNPVIKKMTKEEYKTSTKTPATGNWSILDKEQMMDNLKYTNITSNQNSTFEIY